MSERVRDAMVPAPRVCEASDTAQAAGEALARPEVRQVLVCDGGKLIGVVTRKTLVREVVAAGRDPRETPLREIAEQPYLVLPADADLEQSFLLLEERDLERVPVVDGDELVGILSRGVIQRRLAEDAPPAEEELDQQQV